MLHLKALRFSHLRPRVLKSLRLSQLRLLRDRKLHSLRSQRSSSSPQLSHLTSRLQENRLNLLRLRRLQMEVTWKVTASRISSQLKLLPLPMLRKHLEKRTCRAIAEIY